MNWSKLTSGFEMGSVGFRRISSGGAASGSYIQSDFSFTNAINRSPSDFIRRKRVVRKCCFRRDELDGEQLGWRCRIRVAVRCCPAG